MASAKASESNGSGQTHHRVSIPVWHPSIMVSARIAKFKVRCMKQISRSLNLSLSADVMIEVHVKFKQRFIIQSASRSPPGRSLFWATFAPFSVPWAFFWSPIKAPPNISSLIWVHLGTPKIFKQRFGRVLKGPRN